MESERSQPEIQIQIRVCINNVVSSSGSPALIETSATVQRTYPGVLWARQLAEFPPSFDWLEISNSGKSSLDKTVKPFYALHFTHGTMPN